VTGIGFDHPWRINTWDRFAVPRPYSRARAVLSQAITIPRDLERDQLETFRSGIERLLNRLTLEAEAWAESGAAKAEEIPVRRGPAPPAMNAWRLRGSMQRRAA
jgi:hypothetical protein